MKREYRWFRSVGGSAFEVLKLATFTSFLILAVSTTTVAGTPVSSSGNFAGIYKVAASTDPIFPADSNCDYFLDFGTGLQPGKSSGSVAVSQRRNPNVKVRIMSWQYFPDVGRLAIGNPCAEGSRTAVAAAVWRIRLVSNGVVFERGKFRIILNRVDPDDY